MNVASVLTRGESGLCGLAQFFDTLAGYRRYLAAFLAGACAALALAPFYVTPLMAVGFCALVFMLDGAASEPRRHQVSFYLGWCFGFGYFLVGVYWMAFSFFVQADQFAWMAPFAMLGMPAFLALFSAAAAWAASFFWRSGASRIIVFSVIWVGFEYLRGHVLTGLPWNLVGQVFAGSALASQSAAIYGAYGLSLAAVLLATACAATVTAKGRSTFAGVAVMFGGLVFLGIFGGVRLSLSEPVVTEKTYVRIVQPSIPQRDKINPRYWSRNFSRLLELSRGEAPKDGKLFVIWPENAAPLLAEVNGALAAISTELPENATLLAGAVRAEVDEEGVEHFYNSLAVIEQRKAGREIIQNYDKHHLVPFGEYLPFKGLLAALGLSQLAPFEDGFTPGAGPRTLEASGVRFAPLICYEVIFPSALYPRGERPDWLLTVTNDAWFGDTSGPRQHLDQARLRSIETGLPMARAANTGISAIIDGKGRLLAREKLYEQGRIDALMPAALARTPYDRFGDWPYFLISLVLFGLVRPWTAISASA